MELSGKRAAEKPEILVVDAGGFSHALMRELANTFELEQVEPGQVSGTLLISSPRAVITPYVHVQEVARAIRGAASHAGLPCVALAPPADLTRLKAQAPREVTAVIAEITAPSAISVRLETLILKSANTRQRPKTLIGFGTSPPSASRPPDNDSPPESSSPKTQRAPSVSPVVPEREWIRSSRPPSEITPPEGSSRRAKSPSSPGPSSVGALPEEVLSLRLAVIDDDVTRVDAIARALRLSGHTVFVAAATERHVHWPLLRQFSPQAIVIQPDALSMEGGVWRDAFAKDPFLRQTPLVPIDFSELFSERSGRADTSELQWKFEGIGRAELDFVTEIAAGRSVEVDRTHVNPGRVVALLSELGRSVLVTSSTGTETMSWKIVGGLCGPAEIRSAARSSTLTAKQALDRLLQRPQAKLVVEARKGLTIQKGQDVFQLLEESYNDYIPSPRVPVEAGRRVHPEPSFAPSDSEPPTAPTVLTGLSFGEGRDSEPPTTKANLSELPPELLAKAGLSSPHLPPTPSVDRNEDDLQTAETRIEPFRLARAESPAPSHEATTQVDVKSPELGGDDAGSKKPNWKLLVLIALPVLGAALYLLGRPSSATRGQSVEPAALPRAAPVAPSPQEAQRPPPGPAAQDEPADDPEPEADNLFAVRHPLQLPSCETLLGKPSSEYSEAPRWRADLAWKNARQKLVAGDRDGALRWMCEAAFISPRGPAPAGLVGVYLSERSLAEAHRWAKASLESSPSSNRAREQLGDVLSQMGKQDEAVDLWMSAADLEPNSEKRVTVGNSLIKSARSAVQGADPSLGERLLRRAVALVPADASASGELAGALLTGKEPELAESWAKRTLELDPEQGDALLVLGDLARAQGKVDEARDYYQKVPKTSGDFPRARERLRQL